jgi:hypothetical protein
LTSRGSRGSAFGVLCIADSTGLATALGEADDDIVSISMSDVVGVTEGDVIVGEFVFLHLLLQVAGQ